MLKNMEYVSYPVPEDIQRLIAAGELKRAKAVIEKRLAGNTLPECLKERLRFEERIMEQLPLTYTVTEEEMLAAFDAAVEGFTREEMEDMRDEGTLDWVYLEGKVMYKDNAFANAIKSKPVLHSRLKDQSLLDDSTANMRMIREQMEKMKTNGHSKMRFTLKTSVEVKEEYQRPGKTIRVHLPLPLKDGQCTPVGEIITNPPATYIAKEDEPQRTAYWEMPYEPGTVFSAQYSYEIDAPYCCPDPAKVSPEQPTFDTEEMLPHVRFTPYIRALCAELKGDETNPLLIAKKFYDYVTQNCVYRYVPAYFTKTNIPEYFSAGQRGDCGMHAITFITLCRCAGIPAQWQAGLYTRPGDVGNHDWARFYIAPYGWLYCDGSFGGSAYRAGDMERHNFYFTNLEPFRMVCNRDWQQEFDPPKAFIRADYVDSQDGEMEWEDRELKRFEYSSEKEMLSYEYLD